MSKKDIFTELSYYGLSLLSFLKESHPDKVDNIVFIKSRADLAANTYSKAIKDGLLQHEAEELANEVLYLGLHFSKHDTLINILWNEFSDFVPQSEAKDFAIKIQAASEVVFTRYSLSDEFVDTPQYDRFYTELCGFIDLWLEENEL